MLLEKEIQVSPAEYQVWKNLPTTTAIFQALTDERSLWVEKLAYGDTLRPGFEIKETAIAVGHIAGLTAILEGLEATLIMQWEEAQRRKEEEENEDSQ